VIHYAVAGVCRDLQGYSRWTVAVAGQGVRVHRCAV